MNEIETKDDVESENDTISDDTESDMDSDESDQSDYGDVVDENGESVRHEHEGGGKSSSPAAG